MTKNNLLVGAHVSTAGGFDKAIDRAEEIGANCAQIFTKSNRQWKAKEITKEDASYFKTHQKNSSVKTVVAHAAYLINLGSKNDETIAKSIDALTNELMRCETLSIPYLVLHPGTIRFDNHESKSLEYIAKNINQSFINAKTKNVTLLLETMAGQGNTVGRTFEQLATIIKHVDYKNYIGVCFDTCHVFAAGYEFHTESLYHDMWKHFDTSIGIKKLKAFHINDSQKPCGSRIDRHEHIGLGKIPQKAFKMIMQDERFTKIPKLLETPKGEDQIKNDIKNIKKLKSFM